MSKMANYQIVEDETTKLVLTIRDLGPWHKFWTVTNDIENVVTELAAEGHLPGGRRLFYYDSDGIKDEVIISKGRFFCFQPGPAQPANFAKSKREGGTLIGGRPEANLRAAALELHDALGNSGKLMGEFTPRVQAAILGLRAALR